MSDVRISLTALVMVERAAAVIGALVGVCSTLVIMSIGWFFGLLFAAVFVLVGWLFLNIFVEAARRAALVT